MKREIVGQQSLGIQDGTEKFMRLVPTGSGTRVFGATLVGTLTVLWLSKVSHSSLVGYAYGAGLFTLLSWPFVPRLLRQVRWQKRVMERALGLLIVSLGFGALGGLILGYNPQAQGLSEFNWLLAQKLLWQFPLVLPVENLLLLGAMVGFVRITRARGTPQIMLMALLAAGFFGLWHVPFWGWGTLVTIGLTVLPWTLYMAVTGDVVVPVITHVMMDTTAMVVNFAPNHWVREGFMAALIVAVLIWAVVRSWWEDWRTTSRDLE